MKHISEYEKSVVITLIPNSMKHFATLRVEINPKELSRGNYKTLFDNLLYELRELGFGVSIDNHQSELFNVMEIVLVSYIKEVEVVKDLEERLKEIFGEHSILNRVMIKEKLKKLL